MKTNLKTFPIDTCTSIPYHKWKIDFEAELLEYIGFIDRARSHSPSIEMKIKYNIYKELLGK